MIKSAKNLFEETEKLKKLMSEYQTEWEQDIFNTGVNDMHIAHYSLYDHIDAIKEHFAALEKDLSKYAESMKTVGFAEGLTFAMDLLQFGGKSNVSSVVKAVLDAYSNSIDTSSVEDEDFTEDCEEDGGVCHFHAIPTGVSRDGKKEVAVFLDMPADFCDSADASDDLSFLDEEEEDDFFGEDDEDAEDGEFEVDDEEDEFAEDAEFLEDDEDDEEEEDDMFSTDDAMVEGSDDLFSGDDAFLEEDDFFTDEESVSLSSEPTNIDCTNAITSEDDTTADNTVFAPVNPKGVDENKIFDGLFGSVTMEKVRKMCEEDKLSGKLPVKIMRDGKYVNGVLADIKKNYYDEATGKTSNVEEYWRLRTQSVDSEEQEHANYQEALFYVNDEDKDAFVGGVIDYALGHDLHTTMSNLIILLDYNYFSTPFNKLSNIKYESNIFEITGDELLVYSDFVLDLIFKNMGYKYVDWYSSKRCRPSAVLPTKMLRIRCSRENDAFGVIHRLTRALLNYPVMPWFFVNGDRVLAPASLERIMSNSISLSGTDLKLADPTFGGIKQWGLTVAMHACPTESYVHSTEMLKVLYGGCDSIVSLNLGEKDIAAFTAPVISPDIPELFTPQTAGNRFVQIVGDTINYFHTNDYFEI